MAMFLLLQQVVAEQIDSQHINRCWRVYLMHQLTLVVLVTLMSIQGCVIGRLTLLDVTTVINTTNIVNPDNLRDFIPDNTFKAYIWTKAGTYRYNTLIQLRARPYVQVTLRIADAVNRTAHWSRDGTENCIISQLV